MVVVQAWLLQRVGVLHDDSEELQVTGEAVGVKITTTFAVTIVAVLIYLRDLSAASAASYCVRAASARPTHVCVDR